MYQDNGSMRNCEKYIASANKNIEMSSFKSSENIQKKEGGPDRRFENTIISNVFELRKGDGTKLCSPQLRIYVAKKI